MINIVTPTYSQHFKYNTLFLDSLIEHCEDKDEVIVNFIVSDFEKESLETLLEGHRKKLNIRVVALKDLVKEIFDDYIDDAQLLKDIGKYNFQSLKKLVGAYKFGTPYSLVMDAEALGIRNFKMKNLVDSYFSDKRNVFYTKNDYGNLADIQKKVIESGSKIIGQDPSTTLYFLEAYNWFLDKRILEDLFQEVYSLHDEDVLYVLTKKYEVVFDIVLYYLYIYYNNPKYKYKFVCINDELHKIMGEERYKEYISQKELHTAFEFHAKILNSRYYSKVFEKFYSMNKLNFFKYGILNQAQFSNHQIDFIENTKDIIFLCTLWHVPHKEIQELRERLKLVGESKWH